MTDTMKIWIKIKDAEGKTFVGEANLKLFTAASNEVQSAELQSIAAVKSNSTELTPADLDVIEKRLTDLSPNVSGKRFALELADFFSTDKKLSSFSKEDFQKVYGILLKAKI